MYGLAAKAYFDALEQTRRREVRERVQRAAPVRPASRARERRPRLDEPAVRR